jgi:hypothetical protein
MARLVSPVMPGRRITQAEPVTDHLQQRDLLGPCDAIGEGYIRCGMGHQRCAVRARYGAKLISGMADFVEGQRRCVTQRLVECRDARRTAVALQHAVMAQKAKEAPPFSIRNIAVRQSWRRPTPSPE